MQINRTFGLRVQNPKVATHHQHVHQLHDHQHWIRLLINLGGIHHFNRRAVRPANRSDGGPGFQTRTRITYLVLCDDRPQRGFRKKWRLTIKHSETIAGVDIAWTEALFLLQKRQIRFLHSD